MIDVINRFTFIIFYHNLSTNPQMQLLTKLNYRQFDNITSIFFIHAHRRSKNDLVLTLHRWMNTIEHVIPVFGIIRLTVILLLSNSFIKYLNGL